MSTKATDNGGSSRRFCPTCGTAYPKHDTIRKCKQVIDGQTCGDEIPGGPPDPNREQLGPADCLVCLDAGFVEVLDLGPITCPRRCGATRKASAEQA